MYEVINVVDITWLNRLVAAVVVYYFFLYIHLHVRKWLHKEVFDTSYEPFVFVIIPAHNEEAVIAHTIESLLRQDYTHRAIMVMNDGSHDATSDVAKRYLDRGVIVVDRDLEIAGQGKGEVLNHAFLIINEMVDSHHPVLDGRGPDDVVICIMDADGQLEQGSLRAVVPYFADPMVGGLQIGVRIANVATNTLTRMQDVEFIGFSAFVQEARDAFGSVGLGGNGQFARLAALRSLGRPPWTKCLTEDLDLGLSLVRMGWRNRFCPNAYVAQQGVTGIPQLVRQRTRWIQGHYQCWQHLSELTKSKNVALKTRLDLTLYLVLVIFIVLVTAGFVLSILSMLGLVAVQTSFLAWLPGGALKNAVLLVLSIGPLALFMTTYQTHAASPLKWWEVPAYAFIFAFYTYMWVAASMSAWFRMSLGRDAWAKTQRVESEIAV